MVEFTPALEFTFSSQLKELDDEGLLVRRSGGFSKPNHLYVKIPSDEIGLQPVENKAVEKMALMESEMWHLVK